MQPGGRGVTLLKHNATSTTKHPKCNFETGTAPLQDSNCATWGFFRTATLLFGMSRRRSAPWLATYKVLATNVLEITAKGVRQKCEKTGEKKQTKLRQIYRHQPPTTVFHSVTLICRLSSVLVSKQSGFSGCQHNDMICCPSAKIRLLDYIKLY